MIDMPINKGKICTDVKYIWLIRTILVALLYEFLLNIFKMIAKAKERVSRNDLVALMLVLPMFSIRSSMRLTSSVIVKFSIIIAMNANIM